MERGWVGQRDGEGGRERGMRRGIGREGTMGGGMERESY